MGKNLVDAPRHRHHLRYFSRALIIQPQVSLLARMLSSKLNTRPAAYLIRYVRGVRNLVELCSGNSPLGKKWTDA